MVDRDGEIVLPGEFLPAAEKYGLIAEIDRWVVGRSVELASQGRTVECNLSAASLESPGMLSFIEQEIHKTGADPADLVFEITETALMTDLRVRSGVSPGVWRVWDAGWPSTTSAPDSGASSTSRGCQLPSSRSTSSSSGTWRPTKRIATWWRRSFASLGRSTFAPWPRESKMTPPSSACGPPVSTLVRGSISAAPPQSEHCLESVRPYR